ncbi:MAG: hypothetical protein HQK79_06900 [Desulfobacterales bacterium]|nr:hypothetical protein [Desulfobacterales bacterium]MBF0398022.1 hypothetical protein [Desulfobacterales bacterium]
MKTLSNFLIVLLIVFAFSFNLFAAEIDWQAQNSSGNNIKSIWGASSTKVFAAGEGGVILSYNGTSWAAMTSGTTENLYGIWGVAANSIFAVGDNGTILYYNGTSWSAMTSGTTNNLYGIWGTYAKDVFAVGAGGVILHYNGTSWSTMTSGVTSDLYSVWGGTAKDVFVVGGGGKILYYNGSVWKAMASGTATNLRRVWGTLKSSVYAVGDSGKIIFYNGFTWSNISSGITTNIYGIWGSSTRDIFITTTGGSILHYDGISWDAMVSGVTTDMYNVWGLLGNNVFAVGDTGTILHYGYEFNKLAVDFGGNGLYHYNGTSWTNISKKNASMLKAFGTKLAVKFSDGLYEYDGSSTLISITASSAEGLLGIDSRLYVDLGSSGLSEYKNGTLTQISALNPTALSNYNNKLVAKFSDGLYQYDGTSWTKITSTASEDMIGVGANLYVDFGAKGVYKYKTSWTQIATNNPTMLGSYNNKLVGKFSTGLHEYDGSKWTRISTAAAENIISMGNNLYVDFGKSGLYKYDGTKWIQIAKDNPVSIISYSNKIVGKFLSYIYEYNGTKWTRTATTPSENMVAIK